MPGRAAPARGEAVPPDGVLPADRDAVEDLRAGLGQATDVAGKLRARLPIVAAGALGTGFVIAGGIGATMRLLFRRGREGKEKARVGRFAFIDRR